MTPTGYLIFGLVTLFTAWRVGSFAGNNNWKLPNLIILMVVLEIIEFFAIKGLVS